MMRSVSLCRALARLNFTGQEAQRILYRFQPLITHRKTTRCLQTSSYRFANDEKSDSPNAKGKKKRASAAVKKDDAVNEEMKQAVVRVARSLPGDWTKTANELLERLEMHESPNSQTEAPKTEVAKTVTPNSLLNTMEIGRSFESKRKQMREKNQRQKGRMAHQRRDEDDIYSVSVRDTVGSAQRKHVARRETGFTNLYGARRLNIFDAEMIKKEISGVQQQPLPTDTDGLWARMDAERVRKALGGVPSNGFEEMIQWTKERKLWQFPIDNECYMDEERKYKFHDHIFLEHHLTEFPDKGPIRKFMELVVLGLSKNPWISVPEKVEHIQWFAEYFREKQDIIEQAVGEQGRMKPKPSPTELESSEV